MNDQTAIKEHLPINAGPNVVEKARSNISDLSKKLQGEKTANIENIRFQDKSGNNLDLGIKGASSDEITKAYELDTQSIKHSINLRVNDHGAETGAYANLTLEIEKEFNTQTDHYDIVRSQHMRLNDIFVPDSKRDIGIGKELLSQAEVITEKSGASELYGFPENEKAKEFFKHQGYNLRYNQSGAPEIFKMS